MFKFHCYLKGLKKIQKCDPDYNLENHICFLLPHRSIHPPLCKKIYGTECEFLKNKSVECPSGVQITAHQEKALPPGAPCKYCLALQLPQASSHWIISCFKLTDVEENDVDYMEYPNEEEHHYKYYDYDNLNNYDDYDNPDYEN